jgi:hypothetical protein
MQLHQVFGVGEMGFTAQHVSNGSFSDLEQRSHEVRVALWTGPPDARSTGVGGMSSPPLLDVLLDAACHANGQKAQELQLIQTFQPVSKAAARAARERHRIEPTKNLTKLQIVIR